MDWRHHAACREVDPELFFPIGNTGPALLQIDEAKRVCRRCPVIEGCGRTPKRRQARRLRGSR